MLPELLAVACILAILVLLALAVVVWPHLELGWYRARRRWRNLVEDNKDLEAEIERERQAARRARQQRKDS